MEMIMMDLWIDRAGNWKKIDGWQGERESARNGWIERGINYHGCGGRRESSITSHLSGIYNYIMMHLLSHQLNRQSFFLTLSHKLTLFSIFLFPIVPLHFPLYLSSLIPSPWCLCLQTEKWAHCVKFLVLSLSAGRCCSRYCVKHRHVFKDSSIQAESGGCKHVVRLYWCVCRMWQSPEVR